MAWIFGLSAECETRILAEAFAQYFDNFIVTLADGSTFDCGSQAYSDRDEGWWVNVCPMGISTSGIQNEEDARIMTGISLAFYERLRTAPPYRYAWIGVEVDQFRRFSQLDEDVVKLDFSGLVLADAVWTKLGSPEIFILFAPGYRWRPFERAS